MPASHSIHIEAPVEKVFDFFRNPREWLTLNPDAERREEIVDAHVTPEGLGTFHVWAMKPLPGVRVELFGVFTEFVPNVRIVDRWSVALEGSETYLFEPEGTGTRVTIERRRRSLWRLWPLRTLLDRFEGRQDEAFLGRLKQRMESTRAAPAELASAPGPR